jgi:hypothetical protein
MNEHLQAATSAPLFNPLSPDFIRDPYPHYDLLRTTDPMGRWSQPAVIEPEASSASASLGA